MKGVLAVCGVAVRTSGRRPGGREKDFLVKEAIVNRFLSFSLRTHLLLMAFILVVPAFILIIHAGLGQRQDAIDEGVSEGRRLVYDIATEQYNLAGDAEQLLTVLAQLPEIRSHHVASSTRILADVLRKSPQYGNIVITDRSGDVWASGLPLTRSFSLRERLTFRKAVATRRFSSGDYGVGRISAKPTIGFGYPMIDAQGVVEGVIAVNINFGHFNELIEHAGLPRGSVFSIIDCNGVIIDRNLDHRRYAGTKEREETFLRMKNGAVEASSADFGAAGGNAINAYRKLTLSGEQSPYLYIRASIPLQETQEKALRALISNVAILSLFLAANVMVVMWMGSFVFLRRIRRLQDASRQLAEGDLEVKVSEMVQGGELGSLGQAFDEMARNLSLRESALVRSKAELFDLYNNAPCGYHSLDRNGTIIRINDTELNWLGYPRDEVVGVKTFMDIITPDGRKKLEKSFSLLKERGWVRDLEFGLVRRDGSVITVLMSATAVRDADGSFVMSRSISQDITTRKQIEKKLSDLNQSLARRIDLETEKRLQHERLLARNARLAAIGEMIGAIAHQWRQPLATLGATIQSIRMAWERKRLDDAFLENAEADAQKQLYYMSDTIEDFRNFFSLEKVVETFDVLEKINEVVLLVSPQFSHSRVGLELVDREPGSPARVSGYPNEFKQALLNLISNACDAILDNASRGDAPDGAGLIVVSVGRTPGAVVIEVQDNGCGIPEQYGDKIFEPYFTTKSEGKGTGIGLYMSKLIIEESMGGRLSFTSGPDGTVFRIVLARDGSGEGDGNG